MREGRGASKGKRMVAEISNQPAKHIAGLKSVLKVSGTWTEGLLLREGKLRMWTVALQTRKGTSGGAGGQCL